MDTLRQTYGPDFGAGMRGNAHLDALLNRTKEPTLSQYLKSRRGK